MSRILRRPMFRGGGPVDSYNTGITSGLGYENGGRVGYKQGDVVTGSDLVNFRNQGNTKRGLWQNYGASSLAEALYPGLTPSYPGIAHTERVRLQNQDLERNIDKLYEGFQEEDKPDYDMNFMPGGTFADAAVDSEENQPEVAEEQITKIFKSNALKERPDALDIIPGVSEEPGDDPIPTGDMKIEEMADKYFELMGGKKARGQQFSDMLLRFAGAEGDTVSEKFKNYAAIESKAPDRIRDIKDKSTTLAIQRDIQMEMLDKKIASAETIAEKNALIQLKRDLNKTFAPGITQKKIEYLKTLDKGSKEYSLALADSGLEVSFDKQVSKDNMSGEPLTLDTADVYASIYFPNYKGVLVEGATNGIYLNPKDGGPDSPKGFYKVDGAGNATLFKALNIK